ncbi:hypothetical protein E8E13_003562 [Curvularia kusanoi]|uniref:Uncharacterized protein n=1 Tax=Curvularia kusanoi TaxID=90978 RepID=A0A9P4W866_CURKU|nr:hypothetical protein E8E13_003562 [Curvularia kusanoi]
MAANTGSREHPLQHQVLVSPILENDNQLPTEYSTPKSKTPQSTVTQVPSWPEEGRTLKKHTWLTFVYGIGDLILVLLPIYFILLAVATALLNGKPTKDNEFGRKVEFAMELGPTMFPIIFAAISGRSMKMIARYLAERGSKISTLELLMASQSVWGTVESQIVMQRISLVGANLLFLWALSPLGGQASLRLMRREDQHNQAQAKLRYLTTGPAAAAFIPATVGTTRGKFSEAGSLYNAALLAPQADKLGPRDIWGNVKIPSLEALNTSLHDSDGWVDVASKLATPEMYASLVGIPIAGLPQDARSNFTLEYNYLTVTCGKFDRHLYPGTHGTDDPTATNYTILNQLIPGQVWYNKSLSYLHPFDPLKGRASFLIDTPEGMQAPNIMGLRNNVSEVFQGRWDASMGFFNESKLSKAESERPRLITFASVYGISEDGNYQGLNIVNCSLYQQHVEALVQCDGEQCATSRLRKSLTDTRSNALTAFEHSLTFEYFAQEFPTAIKFNEGSSPTEKFMANTSVFPYIQQAGNTDRKQIYVDLNDVPPETFSRRLSLMLNSYYQLSTQSSGYFGDLTTNLSAYGPDTLPVTDANVYIPSNISITNISTTDWFTPFQQKVWAMDSPFMGATTTAEITTSTQIFVCDFAWFALLVAASGVIFITGLIAVVLKRKTLGPEMFGFVSSMTYENPWLSIPSGGTMLDGMERARLLKDIEVCIADVRGNEEKGHIALAAGVPLRKLERGRLYC